MKHLVSQEGAGFAEEFILVVRGEGGDGMGWDGAGSRQHSCVVGRHLGSGAVAVASSSWYNTKFPVLQQNQGSLLLFFSFQRREKQNRTTSIEGGKSSQVRIKPETPYSPRRRNSNKQQQQSIKQETTKESSSLVSAPALSSTWYCIVCPPQGINNETKQTKKKAKERNNHNTATPRFQNLHRQRKTTAFIGSNNSSNKPHRHRS
mmetsp:Transcript_57613/g.140708  ORF Transcript_57613/g.140708 Transcript_57613/m.140708 type:complete len:205 (+) Transcript_57613:166-780(+)